LVAVPGVFIIDSGGEEKKGRRHITAGHATR
jgi:hypothetical protein